MIQLLWVCALIWIRLAFTVETGHITVVRWQWRTSKSGKTSSTAALMWFPLVWAMSKSLRKRKNHWTNKVHESVLCRNEEGELGLELKGGAENGLFPVIGELLPGRAVCHSGKLCQDELLLEVNDTPVAGLTTRDVHAVVKHSKDPVRVKCVKQGELFSSFHTNFPAFRNDFFPPDIKKEKKRKDVRFLTRFCVLTEVLLSPKTDSLPYARCYKQTMLRKLTFCSVLLFLQVFWTQTLIFSTQSL